MLRVGTLTIPVTDTQGQECLHLTGGYAGPRSHVVGQRGRPLTCKPVGLSDEDVKQSIIEEHLEKFPVVGVLGEPQIDCIPSSGKAVSEWLAIVFVPMERWVGRRSAWPGQVARVEEGPARAFGR